MLAVARASRLAVLAVVALVVALLPQFAAAPAHAASINESEPNNSTATADGIRNGQAVVGRLAPTASSNSYDDDYFAIDVPQAGRLTLSLYFPKGLGAGDLYDLEVLDASGKALYDFRLDGTDYDGKWLAKQATYVPKGRFYIRISGSRWDASWNAAYTLLVGHKAGAVETEGNNDSRTADVIRSGKGLAGSLLSAGSYDTDTFAIDAARPGRLVLGLSYPKGLGTSELYDVRVYDAAGTERFDFALTGAQYTGAWLEKQAMYVPAGRFYIEVSGSQWDASWGKGYVLKAGLQYGTVETEVNNATSTADALPLGRTILGSALNGSSYDDDYFALDVSRGGNVVIDFRFPAGLGTSTVYDLDLLDQNGRVIREYSLTGAHASGSGLVKQPIYLSAGRTYLRVSADKWDSSWGKGYQLTVSRVLTVTPTPTVAGNAKVGATLAGRSKAWGPAPVTLSYQWLRNGKPIKGAVRANYTVVSADRGSNLSLMVTGAKQGYRPASKISAPVYIKKTG